MNYTVGCAGGYKPANASKTTTVMCMVTGDADEWEGDAYWAVTAGAGRVATTCNASDLAATHINAVPAAKAGPLRLRGCLLPPGRQCFRVPDLGSRPDLCARMQE